MYISLTQLAARPGAQELAQVATPAQSRVVNTDLMLATLNGADRSAWPADEIAVADAALARINDAIADAVAMIDGFLGRRGYLPLNPVPGIVTTWCRAITRYFLHQDRLKADDKDTITRDYKDAQRLLQLTAEGKFSLGGDDAVVTTGAGEPEFTQGSTTFRDALKDY
ncbi:gp436 family protein [Rheinheimera maricola]|uniref:DUF1320 domain-containing protein n=1 Tax=Rheinheimera maricola TaxID=2793282 RepID=A0ABS7X6L7_9GAMM|nr:DUF1320 domain-containing protein [Rheinheimera maricola]MBZ9610805.1 DUF1320 domain-containing protein [Rheinheimera maricola]